MPSPKKLFARILLMCFALLIPVFFVEVLLRLSPTDTKERIDPNFDRSPYVFHSQENRLHSWLQGQEPGLKVAVIGDSITNGSGVQPHDSYGMRLERLLNMNDNTASAEVNIYAKGGTSTATQYDFLTKAIDWNPDVIVLGICLNDAEDWHDKTKHNLWRDEMMPRVPSPRLAKLLRASKALSWMYRKAEDRRAIRGYYDYYTRLYGDDYSGWQKMEKALVHFKTVCDQHQIKFVAAIFPMFSNSLSESDYPFKEAHEKITGVLSGANAHTLDLFEFYKNKSSIRMQAYPFIDGHPSEIAHRIAAENILGYLIQHNMIDKSYLPIERSNQKNKYFKRMKERMRQPILEDK